jgi:hypothetical protein
MNSWHSIHIADKTGKKFFKTEASPMSTASEIRNLQRHVDAIKANAKGYEFVDSASVVLMLDGVPYGALDDILMSDDELLVELGI